MPTWRAGISSNRGFTFVEISVVLLIIAVFSAAALPRLTAFLAGRKSEQSAARLGFYLEHVRDEAVFKRRLLLLKCEIGEGRFTVFEAGGEEAREAMMKPLNFPDEVKIVDIEIPGREKVSEGETSIAFYPGGMAEGALIHLKGEDGLELTLEIAPLSRRVRIHEGYAEAV